MITTLCPRSGSKSFYIVEDIASEESFVLNGTPRPLRDLRGPESSRNVGSPASEISRKEGQDV